MNTKKISLANSRHLLKSSIDSLDNWPLAASLILDELNALSSVQVSNRDVYLHFEGDKVHVSRTFTGFFNPSSDSSYQVLDFDSCEAVRLELQIGDIYGKKEQLEAKITNAGLSLKDGLKYWLRISFRENIREVSLECFKTK